MREFWRTHPHQCWVNESEPNIPQGRRTLWVRCPRCGGDVATYMITEEEYAVRQTVKLLD